jgi:hypothetical protein
MSHNFEDSVPFERIDYYEGETANVLCGMIRFLYILPEDFGYFDFDKNVAKEFVRFILERIEEGKVLSFTLKKLFVINRTKYPGEY